jgi:lipoyl-dependent peroxiredoxin
MIRKSKARWQGDGLHGKGGLTTQSGVLHEHPYSFLTRFQSEDGKAGTNPEELLAAAHAGCYAMALSFALSEAGHPPDEIRVTAGVPGIDGAKFDAIAQAAKKGCPISKALAATPITLSVKLD